MKGAARVMLNLCRIRITLSSGPPDRRVKPQFNKKKGYTPIWVYYMGYPSLQSLYNSNSSLVIPANSNHHLNLLLAKLIIYLPLIAFIPTIRLRTQTRIAPRTEHHTIPIVRIDTLRISIRPTFMAIYRRLPLLDR